MVSIIRTRDAKNRTGNFRVFRPNGESAIQLPSPVPRRNVAISPRSVGKERSGLQTASEERQVAAVVHGASRVTIARASLFCGFASERGIDLGVSDRGADEKLNLILRPARDEEVAGI